ncbi:MAG: arginase [Alphaproteobacteria bacterium]|nr:arginase [Alphaproteobacteria bacterium]
MKLPRWNIVGVGSGWGAGNMGTADGPQVLIDNMPSSFQEYSKSLTYWHDENPLCFANPKPLPPLQAEAHAQRILEMALWLSAETKQAFLRQEIPLVLGGDHSIAIGTWSGIKDALGNEDLGLIWIDAHMDAHTPNTSPSLNIHGMPVAVLLGKGDQRFTNLLNTMPKIKPENLFLIGIRSFEKGEADLLENLGVRIYPIKEVKDRGLHSIIEEIRAKLSSRRFGLSLDIDAMDPEEAPGTGTPEVLGLRYSEIAHALNSIAQDPAFIALEITEFNPHRDKEHKTSQLIWKLITTMTGTNHGKHAENF